MKINKTCFPIASNLSEKDSLMVRGKKISFDSKHLKLFLDFLYYPPNYHCNSKLNKGQIEKVKRD